MANDIAVHFHKVLEEIDLKKDYIIQSVGAIYYESKKIVNELYWNEDDAVIINLKKKLVLYHGQLTAVKDILVMNGSAEQKEMSESSKISLLIPNAENLCTFPVELKTEHNMIISHFISATGFWLCSANNEAKSSLNSLLLEKLQQKCLAEFVDAKPGDLVIARTPIGIIRALIQEQCEPLKSKLVDIDSGRKVTAKCKLYKLDADIMKFHQQAVFCCLDLPDPLLYKSDNEVEKKLLAGSMSVKFIKTSGTSSNKYVTKWSVIVQLKSPIPEVNNNNSVVNEQANKAVHVNDFAIVLSDTLAKIAVFSNEVKKTVDENTFLHDTMSISSGATSSPQVLSLKQEEKLDVVVSHFESPYQIYVYTANVEATHVLDRMHEQMQLVYGSMKQTAYVAQEGDIIAVNCNKYNQWARGKVLNWEKQENGVTQKVSVFLIDYGDIITVPDSHCSDLALAFQRQPAFVQCISLSQIYPVFPHKDWSVSVKQELKKILNFKVVTLYVLESSKDGATPSVTMYMKLGKHEININKLMVQKKMATFLPIEHRNKTTVCTKDNKEVYDLWDPMKEDYYLGHMEDGSVNQAVLGYNPKDEQRVCYLFQKTGSCNRLSCQKEHIKLHPDGWTTDQEEVAIEAFNSLELPVTGSRCFFKVTEILEINHMFGILTTGFSLDNGTLEELVEYINDPKERTETLTTVPGVGQLVLCKEPTESVLYRARVLDISDHINVQEVFIKVYFVDYGNTDWMELQNLRAIPSKFLHLPFQAVEFKVEEFVAKTNCSVEAKQQLMHLVEKHTVSADVISTKPGQYQTWSVVLKNVQINTTPLYKILQDYVDESKVTEVCVAEDSTILPG